MVRRSHPVFAVSLLAILPLAACGDGDDGAVGDLTTTSSGATTTAVTTTAVTTTSTTSGGTSTTVAGLAQVCTNDEAGYRVRYPQGWHTNDGSVVAACRLFDPAPIEVPENSEIPFDIAVLIQQIEVPYPQAVEVGEAQEELSRQTLTVNGRQATYLEVRSTGRGLGPAGIVSSHYYLDLPGGTVLVSTYDVEGVDYEANQDVLDLMIRSLEVL